MLYLSKHIPLVNPALNLSVLTDPDVDTGFIFRNHNETNNKYQILILGHQEYVTQQEYDNLRKFVANGGSLILLDGNIFYAEVGYDRTTQTITLIKGHGWSFNGRSAWKSINERWANETSQWIGSNYFCYECVNYANNPFGYKKAEEQYLTNPNDTIFLRYNYSVAYLLKYISHIKGLDPHAILYGAAIRDLPTHMPIVASYILNYKKGRVLGLGLYTDDLIFLHSRNFMVFLDHLIMLPKQLS